MVEMAGNIIMSYLLVLDAQRDPIYKKTAKVYLEFSKSENHKRADFIYNFDIDDLTKYKYE